MSACILESGRRADAAEWKALGRFRGPVLVHQLRPPSVSALASYRIVDKQQAGRSCVECVRLLV